MGAPMNNSDATRVLGVLVKALDRHFSGQYFIAEGTLLGCIRDDDFITRDNDIDIGLWADAYDPVLIEDMLAAGFTLDALRGAPDAGMQIKFSQDAIPVDMFLIHRETDHFWFVIHPACGSLLSTLPVFDLTPHRFKGVDVMIPTDAETYLEHTYGPDWRRPVHRWNFKYCQANLEPIGSWFWRHAYPVRRAWWHFKNPDIFAPETRKRRGKGRGRPTP